MNEFDEIKFKELCGYLWDASIQMEMAKDWLQDPGLKERAKRIIEEIDKLREEIEEKE